MEFAVIVLGVMVALVADRWLQERDFAAQTEGYLLQLSEDLRADSAALAAKIAEAETRGRTAVLLLEVVEGLPLPEDVSAAQLVADFEMVAWFTSMDVTRDTWDDLVSTGNTSLIEPPLRRRLSRHYNMLEAFSGTEEDWEIQLQRLETDLMDTQDPVRRMAAVQSVSELPFDDLLGRLDVEPISAKDLANVSERLSVNPELLAGIGHLRLMWAGAVVLYGSNLASTTEVLREVDRRAP